MALGDYTIQGSYADVINIFDDSNPNVGLLSTMKAVSDGKGNKTPLLISDSAVEIKGSLGVEKVFTSDGVIGKETALTSSSILLSSDHVDLKVGTDSVLQARKTGEIRLKSLSNAPTSGSALGDLINQSGTLYVCVGV